MSERPLALALGVALAVASAGGCAPDAATLAGDGGAAAGPVCVSGEYWARGEDGDNWMHPGGTCIGCHDGWHRGPVFSVAGTIYHDFNEENDCNGFPGDFSPVQDHAAIEITDSTGTPFVIVANRVGNFYSTHPLRYPLLHIRVRAPNGMISQMSEPAPHGDCNACHTRDGTTTPTGVSPGRVVIPQ